MRHNRHHLLPPEAGSSAAHLEALFQNTGFDTEDLLTIATGESSTDIAHMRRQVIADFNCTKPSHKMLADTLISDVVLSARLSQRMNLLLDKTEITDLTVQHIQAIGRELDRSRRRVLAAYQALAAITQPKINVNIRAKNAVIGQNQQFNNNASQNNQ